MNHWNYRVIKTHDKEHDEVSYGIHEVYYDELDIPANATEKPVRIECESLEGLEETLEKMRIALDKTVLTDEDFINNNKE